MEITIWGDRVEELRIVLSQGHDQQDCEYVRNHLYEFNGQHVPIIYEPINLFLRNEADALCGGLLASHYWNCLLVDILWIAAEYRYCGYGRRLMTQIEAIARGKGVDLIHLDTHGFQAPGFYLKLGYEIFGVLDGSPRGYQRYYLKKVLR